jgi:4-oxalocrotonate tautomerase
MPPAAFIGWAHNSVLPRRLYLQAPRSYDQCIKEIDMPHVIVKLWPGPSEKEKALLADRIVKDLVSTIGTGEESVSVSIEEVKPGDWMQQVYRPDIEKNMDRLYKKPGYVPF